MFLNFLIRVTGKSYYSGFCPGEFVLNSAGVTESCACMTGGNANCGADYQLRRY